MLLAFEPPQLTKSQKGKDVIVQEGAQWLVQDRKEVKVKVNGVKTVVPNRELVVLRCQSNRKKCACTAKIDYNMESKVYSNFRVDEGKSHTTMCIWSEETICFEIHKNRIYQELRADETHASVKDAYTKVQGEYAKLRPVHAVNHFHPLRYFQGNGDKIIGKRYVKQPTLAQLAAMNIPHKFTTTLREGEDFLLHKESFYHPPDASHPDGSMETILVFATEQRFREICTTASVWADGTFKVCPKPFYQLYILHRVYNNSTRPCVFVLMSRKTKISYGRLFQRLKELAIARGHPFEMVNFHCDYELAVISSVSAVFSNPVINIRGCYFHLCSAMFKKFVKYGHKGHYRKLGVKLHVKMCMALAFLPVDKIAQTLDEIEAAYNALNDVPLPKPNLTRFFQYVRRSWVGGKIAALGAWSHYGKYGRRTSCDIEGYHSALNDAIYGHGRKTPGLWPFIECLKTEEHRVHMDILTARYGGLLKTRSKRQRDIEAIYLGFKVDFDMDPDNNAYNYVLAVARHAITEDQPADFIDVVEIDLSDEEDVVADDVLGEVDDAMEAVLAMNIDA